MKTKMNITTWLMLSVLLAVFAAGCATPAATATPTEETIIPEEPVETATEVLATEPAAAEETAEPVNPELLEGKWEGTINVAGGILNMAVTFTGAEDGLLASLDISDQGLYGYELANVEFTNPSISFEGFEEMNGKAVWAGELSEDEIITGEFTQLGYTGTFELTKVDMAAAAQATQTALAALTYREEEVSITNQDVTLGGTLSLPEGEGPFPVVILITGSGAQNRDEEILGFKPFGIIADYLATNSGVAVLRYDDRGIGASTGDTASSTSEDFTSDVLAWVEYLKTRPDIDPKAIGLLGHSEGGLIAPMAASQSEDIAFIVLMGGPAQSGEEIIYKQVELIARASGVPEDQITEALAQQRRLFDGLIRGQDWEGAKEELRQQIVDQVNALPEAQKQTLGDLDQYAENAYQQQITSLESPWYRYFVEYDPMPVLEELTTTPVLALFGGLDLQVPADPNADMMKTALEGAGNLDVTVITYPKANHLFQTAITGNPSEYSTLEPVFTEDFLEDIARWLRVEISLINQS